MQILVLGPGCMRCRQLENNAMKAVMDLDIDCDVEKVSNLQEIAKYGVVMTPGLVINGEVKSTGKVLTVEQIKTLLKLQL